MDQSATSVLVLGAGELGLAMLTALSHKSKINPQLKVTALLRPATINAVPPTEKGKHVSYIRNELSIDLVPGYIGGIWTQLKLAQAALNAGDMMAARTTGGGKLRYFPWQFGADYDLVGRGSALEVWDEQLDVRDLLRRYTIDNEGNGTVEWTILMTGIFASFLFEPWWGCIDLSDPRAPIVRALGSWDNRVMVSTPEDIGMVVAELVVSQECDAGRPRPKNEKVKMAGETVSYDRFADIIEKVLGRKVKREVWTVDKLKEELRNDPSNTIKKYRVVFAEGQGVSWDESETVNRHWGIQTLGLEQFASERLSVTDRQ